MTQNSEFKLKYPFLYNPWFSNIILLAVEPPPPPPVVLVCLKQIWKPRAPPIGCASWPPFFQPHLKIPKKGMKTTILEMLKP